MKAPCSYIIRVRIINLTLCFFMSFRSVLTHHHHHNHPPPSLLPLLNEDDEESLYTICQADRRTDRETGRQGGRQAEMDFKMAFWVVSPAWMRQAAYEKALLDIDGDKAASRNEPFLTRVK